MSVDKKINYKDIKGQKHMLAYITPGEAKTLEKLGGQKTMTPEGIPAYPPGGGDWGGSTTGGGSTGRGEDGGGSGRERGAEQNRTQTTPTPAPTRPSTRPNPHTPSGTSPVSFPSPTPTPTPTGPSGFNIHGGPTYKAPPKVPDMIGPSYVPGVTYNTGLETQRLKNIQLQNELLNTPYQGINTPFMGLNFLGNTLGKIGYNKNTKFFVDNSIGGKINPETGKPFGYGIDGYKDYMRQRTLGNVGAYGGTELSQNAINARSGGDNGIMDVYNDPNDPDDGDSDGDGDVDQDDFIFRYFDKTGETLQAGAGGVQDLMTQIRKRISDIFS
jgi:hypothetical protein